MKQQRRGLFSLEVFEREWHWLDAIARSNNPFGENRGTKPLVMESSTDTMLRMIRGVARSISKGGSTEKNVANTKKASSEGGSDHVR